MNVKYRQLNLYTTELQLNIKQIICGAYTSFQTQLSTAALTGRQDSLVINSVDRGAGDLTLSPLINFINIFAAVCPNS